MTKFSIIQGGGNRRPPLDPDARPAADHLHQLMVELVRAIVRGDDFGDRVSREFTALFDLVSKSKQPIRPIVQQVVADANRSLTFGPERSENATEMAEIVFAAMRVAAESLDRDEYAKGRRAQRMGELRALIERHIVATEARSREHGWSYLDQLTKDLGPKSPQRRKPRG